MQGLQHQHAVPSDTPCHLSRDADSVVPASSHCSGSMVVFKEILFKIPEQRFGLLFVSALLLLVAIGCLSKTFFAPRKTELVNPDALDEPGTSFREAIKDLTESIKDLKEAVKKGDFKEGQEDAPPPPPFDAMRWLVAISAPLGCSGRGIGKPGSEDAALV